MREALSISLIRVAGGPAAADAERPPRELRWTALKAFLAAVKEMLLFFTARPPVRVTMRRSKRRRMRRGDLVDMEAEMPFRQSNAAMRSWRRLFGQQSAGPACQMSQNIFTKKSTKKSEPYWFYALVVGYQSLPIIPGACKLVDLTGVWLQGVPQCSFADWQSNILPPVRSLDSQFDQNRYQGLVIYWYNYS